MKLVVQRVREASVTVAADSYRARIGRGVLILLGVEKGDTRAEADWLAAKVARLRIFPNPDRDRGRNMDRSLLDVGGEALVVSQFTLAGDCAKGRRPAFDRAAPPEAAEPLCAHFRVALEQLGVRRVATGVFGAMMEVSLVNDGPVTFVLERTNRKHDE